MSKVDWAVVVPMANEEEEFQSFIDEMTLVLDRLQSGAVYIVVDSVSKDSTWDLCQSLSSKDGRYRPIWAPENRCLVDAYIRGFKEAYENGHEIIIEMDAGLSHDPKAIPTFIDLLGQGYDCVFGSRFVDGGSMSDSPLKRRLLSSVGTGLANVLLGTRLRDMTSGFQGFRSHVVAKLINYQLKSTAHFYQTEVRYLLRHTRHIEVPIHYRAPSPRVSSGAIANSVQVLMTYAVEKMFGTPSQL